MTEPKLNCKFTSAKRPLLERSISFHTRKQLSQLNYPQQKFKITFVKDVSTTQKLSQIANGRNLSNSLPKKRSDILQIIYFNQLFRIEMLLSRYVIIFKIKMS